MSGVPTICRIRVSWSMSGVTVRETAQKSGRRAVLEHNDPITYNIV